MDLYDHVIKTHREVSVIGRSLGSGVAVYLTTQRTVDRLILVTPFDSIKAIAQQLLPILPVQFLLKDSYDSKSRAGQIDSPTFIVMAAHDEVIPAKNTLSLVRSIPSKHLKSFKSLNAGHNDLDSNPNYFKTIQSFLSCSNSC